MSHYAVTNPATGEVIRTYPEITDEALVLAVGAGAEAHLTWGRRSTVAERVVLIQRVGDLHRERREELAAIIVMEMGKTLEGALGEVDFCADIYDYYAENAGQFLADEPIQLLGGEGSGVVRRSSLGLLLGIMPWNYPYYQVSRFAAPNLAIGNTILLKHAPQCPESAAALEKIFHDAGFPAGAYQNVYASNDQVQDIIADPRVQGVSLTGSERAGAAVAEIAGRHLKKVVLELGGSDPFVLLSSADLDATVEDAVVGRLENTGQACNAAKRFIVLDDLYDAFVEKFTEALLNAKVGDPSEADTVVGPMSSAAAAERLHEQVERAVAQGASIVRAGEPNGTFYPPAVLTGVTVDNDIHREELFGPVAVVYRVATEEEAISVANDTPFGLGSYVYSSDPDQAARVADALEAGMVYVNIVGADSPELPFGGVKRSGSGRELGRFGADEFVNKKLIRTGA